MSNEGSSSESLPESLSKFCVTCEDIGLNQYVDPKVIKQSALMGCSRCGLIVQAMDKMVPEWAEQLDRELSSVRYPQENQSFELYWSSDREGDTEVFEVFTVLGKLLVIELMIVSLFSIDS
jgi:hypothetical protein